MPFLPRSPTAILAGASSAQAAAAFVNFGLPAIGPVLRAEYGLTLFELGAILSAGLLGSGVALTAAGSLVDRVGARSAMLAGTTLGTAGLLAAAFAPSALVLFASLFAFGVGTAVVPVAGAGALFRAFPPRRRGWALGVRQTAVPLGGTIAAMAFPGLHALAGVRLALLVGAAAVAATGLAFGAIAGDDRVRDAPRVVRPFRTILRAPGMGRLLLVATCYIVVLQALLAYVVPAVRAAGHSPFTASVAYVAVNATAVVTRVVWGHIADRDEGRRRVRTLVEVGLVASAGAALFAVALHIDAVASVVAAVIFAVGALGWNALVYVTAGERAGMQLAGRSVAVAATVVFVISGIATPVLGGIAEVAGWDALWLSAAVVAAVGALLSRRLTQPLPAAPPAPLG